MHTSWCDRLMMILYDLLCTINLLMLIKCVYKWVDIVWEVTGEIM